MPGVMVFLSALLELGGLSNEELKASGSLLLLDAGGYRSTFRAGSNVWRNLQFFRSTENNSDQTSLMEASRTDEVSSRNSDGNESNSEKTSDVETKTSDTNFDSSMKTTGDTKESA